MKLAAYQAVTLVDFPGHIACTVFTVGCNFRCKFCYNIRLVVPGAEHEVLEQERFFDFLRSRVGKLDGVCVSGGEPTLHEDLPAFLRRIKGIGFAVKLDTNGTNPAMLAEVTDSGLVDYVAMDVKAPWEKYDVITQSTGFASLVKESLEILKHRAIPFEVRTTLHPDLLSEEDVVKIARSIDWAPCYSLQNYIPAETIDPVLSNSVGFTRSEMEHMKCAVQAVTSARIYVKNV